MLGEEISAAGPINVQCIYNSESLALMTKFN